MPSGRTVARTLGLGARCAPRVWPLAVLVSLPSLAMSYALDVAASGPASVPALLGIPLGYASNAVLTAAVLPALVRSFSEPGEVLAPHVRDMRGRLAPALVAALTSSLIAILIGPVLLSRVFGDFRHLSDAALCALVIVIPVAYWLRLRLMLMVEVAAIEACDPLTALRRSWLLTRGRAALLTMVGLSCVLGLLMMLPMFVVAIVGGSDAIRTMTTRPWINMAIALALSPFFLALSAVLYHDFRRRLDHVDSERIAAEAGPL